MSSIFLPASRAISTHCSHKYLRLSGSDMMLVGFRLSDCRALKGDNSTIFSAVSQYVVKFCDRDTVRGLRYGLVFA